MQISQSVLSKTEHRKGAQNELSKTEHRKGPAGYRQGVGRVRSNALLHRMGPGCMSAAPGRRPVRTRDLLKGALRLQILM